MAKITDSLLHGSTCLYQGGAFRGFSATQKFSAKQKSEDKVKHALLLRPPSEVLEEMEFFYISLRLASSGLQISTLSRNVDV